MNILLLGCGNIGSAFLEVWSSLKWIDKIVVVQPSLSNQEKYKQNLFIEFVSDISLVNKNFKPDVVVLAVKPQTIKTCLSWLESHCSSAIIVSVVASLSLKLLTSYIGYDSRLVRIMPNVAIRVAKSTNLSFAKNLNENDKELIEKIFSISGNVIWMDKEEDLDLLTPISGCGPAYFFLLAELLEQEVEKLGVRQKLAKQIVKQTFDGSAQLLKTGQSFQELKKSVMSKKGITEAALTVMDPHLRDIMKSTLKAAQVRLVELTDEILKD